MLKAVAYQAEQGNYRDIRICVVQHFIRIIADQHAGLHPKACIVPYVHAYDLRVYVNGSYDLRAFLYR